MIRLTTLILGSCANLGFSWRYLRRPYLHGFYRFFAFQSILLLIFANWRRWFLNPFTKRQLLSWSLLSGSALLAWHGFHLLSVAGKPQGAIENTTRLVRTGVYRYIRHPLYASLLLFGAGAFLKGMTVHTSLVLIGLLSALYATARVEENENMIQFGGEYAAYRESSKFFIPYLF